MEEVAAWVVSDMDCSTRRKKVGRWGKMETAGRSRTGSTEQTNAKTAICKASSWMHAKKIESI